MNLLMTGGCFAVALFWTSAILMGRASGLDPITGGSLACLGTGTVGLFMLPFVNYTTLTRAGLGMGYGGGIVNGLGLALIFAMFCVAAEKGWHVSKITPTSYSMVAVFVLIGTRILFGEVVSVEKTAGIGLILVGLWFLK